MRPVVPLIVHAEGTDTAWFEQVLREFGAAPRVVRADRGEPLPGLDDVLGVVVLGGPMGAYEAGRYPFLTGSMRLLERLVEREVPTLAICLGAQLLATATGGRAYPGHGREWGYIPVRLTQAGHADPVLADVEGEYLSFHADTFEPPPGSEVLAESPAYPQAFRVGSALGLQFHPEMSSGGVRRLLAATEPSANGAASDLRGLLTASVARDTTALGVFRRLIARWAPQLVSPHP